MALQVQETWESGEGTLGRDARDLYSVIVYGNPATQANGGDNADDPGTIMLFAIPKFSIQSALGNIIHNFSRERIAPGMWKVTAEYRSSTYDRQTNDASFSFTLGAGTKKVTQSIQTVSKYGVKQSDGSTSTPPDFQGGIEVDPSTKVPQGTDIDVTTFDFRTTFYVSAANLQSSYVRSLVDLRGHYNSDSVTINVDGIQLQFNPGELRFLHADGSKRVGFGDWEFTLNWSALPNVQNGSLGPITGINAKGWDYLWVLYQQQPDTSANMLKSVPIAAYVEQVYYSSALTPLLLQSQFGNSNAQGWANPSPVNGTGVKSGGS